MLDSPPNRLADLASAFVAAGIIGYLLPWIVAPSAAMTLSAFDLAEWSSLHPAQGGTLEVALLLRAQLVILTVMVGASAVGKRVALAAVLILLLAIAQVPPFEFVNDPGNLNYRQQLILAACSVTAGLAAALFARGRLSATWLSILTILLSLAGLATSIMGLQGAQALLAQLGQAADPGAGIWILGFSYLGLTGVSLIELTRDRPR